MIGVGEIFSQIKEAFGGTRKKTEVPVTPIFTPPTETEPERLLRLKNQNLADRKANSMPQSGGGAFGGTSVPAVAAEPGKSAFTILTKEKKAAVKDTTGLGPPL